MRVFIVFCLIVPRQQRYQLPTLFRMWNVVNHNIPHTERLFFETSPRGNVVGQTTWAVPPAEAGGIDLCPVRSESGVAALHPLSPGELSAVDHARKTPASLESVEVQADRCVRRWAVGFAGPLPFTSSVPKQTGNELGFLS